MASTTAKRRNPIYEGFRDELEGDIVAILLHPQKNATLRVVFRLKLERFHPI
jgi:hypothetical protein